MAIPRSVLLIITGSIAAYKSLELIRLLKAQGIAVHAILTKSGAQFITPLAVSALTGTKTYDNLFSLTDEIEMGHIELSRIADCVLVAPASADILAKMAAGIADDLATTALLATNKPVIVAPAMNHKMWFHAATQRNLAQLRKDSIAVIEPTEGDMACGEFGIGRMAEPVDILKFLSTLSQGVAPAKAGVHAKSGATNATWIPAFAGMTPPLAGRTAIVTSGPTAEPIDPVRYLGNRSSGKQGHAIAESLAAAGARVTLVTGRTELPDPANVNTIHVTTTEEMQHAVQSALPADIFVGAAAVADWRMTHVSSQKIKKHDKTTKLTLELVPTVDILATISTHKKRPALVIGFAAETDQLEKTAVAKRNAKGCDWMLANLVKDGAVFGAEDNEILFITAEGRQRWKRMSKRAVADELTARITEHFNTTSNNAKLKRKATH